MESRIVRLILIIGLIFVSDGISQAETAAVRVVRVPILMYHLITESNDPGRGITLANFEGQMALLKKLGYKTISLEALAEALDPTPELRRKRLPSKAVVITFDDGYENCYTKAFAILQKYRLTATFFVITGLVEEDDQDRDHVYMTWDEIGELYDAGNEIGSHTETHRDLTALLNYNDLMAEIADSADIIKKQIGVAVNVFAYPFGKYDDEVIKIVSGYYKAAVAIDGGGIKHRSDEIYKLKRILIYPDMKLDMFEKDLKGLVK